MTWYWDQFLNQFFEDSNYQTLVIGNIPIRSTVKKVQILLKANVLEILKIFKKRAFSGHLFLLKDRLPKANYLFSASLNTKLRCTRTHIRNLSDI